MFNIHTLQARPRSTLYLQQHFKGWYIETPDDRFDLSAATIFDFRTPQDGELRFFYLLPTSPRSALVEYVGLSLVDSTPCSTNTSGSVLGVPEYTVVSDEIGITPMTDYVFPRAAGRHVMRTGIQGGLAKPTTGYAYTRIQERQRGHRRLTLRTRPPVRRSADERTRVPLAGLRDASGHAR